MSETSQQALSTPVRRSALAILGQILTISVAAVLIAGWSVGLAAIFRDRYHLPVPQWVVFVFVLSFIAGVLTLAAKGLRTGLGQKILTGIMICLFLPMIATVFGGVYYWAAAALSKGRVLWMNVLLAAGLVVTVVGFGLATKMTVPHIAIVAFAGVGGLLAMVVVHRNSCIRLMGYGGLHFVVLLSAMAVASVENDQKEQGLRGSSVSMRIFPDGKASPGS